MNKGEMPPAQATDIPCTNGCKNPQGKLVKMMLISARYDVIFKKNRIAMQCPMCGRWEFER
jgi:hypothetical protein